MYMRMVHASIRAGAFADLRTHYEQTIIPALGGVEGCLYAGLMNNASRLERFISLTFWRSQKDAEAYEQSGVFQKLWDGLRPLLSETSESHVQLSEDLTLEIVPGEVEPEVSAYAVETVAREKTNLEPSYWVRIVTLKVRTDALAEFKKLYHQKIVPQLRAAEGCRQVLLSQSVAEPETIASVTVWNSREEAEMYERDGTFHRLLDMTKHTLTDLYRWKMEKEKEPDAHVVTSEDMLVETFDLLVGRSFE
jgi:quinol monooxygenase YgiN